MLSTSSHANTEKAGPHTAPASLPKRTPSQPGPGSGLTVPVGRAELHGCEARSSGAWRRRGNEQRRREAARRRDAHCASRCARRARGLTYVGSLRRRGEGTKVWMGGFQNPAADSGRRNATRGGSPALAASPSVVPHVVHYVRVARHMQNTTPESFNTVRASHHIPPPRHSRSSDPPVAPWAVGSRLTTHLTRRSRLGLLTSRFRVDLGLHDVSHGMPPPHPHTRERTLTSGCARTASRNASSFG